MTLTHPGAPALTAALDCFFVRPGEDERARTAGRQVLGRVTYGHSGRPPTLYNGAPLVRTAMADAATERITEVWTTDRPVRSGRDGGRVLDNNNKILAVEFLAAAQAVDISNRYDGLSPASKATYDAVRALVPTLGVDRYMADDIELIAAALSRGEFLDTLNRRTDIVLR